MGSGDGMREGRSAASWALSHSPHPGGARGSGRGQTRAPALRGAAARPWPRRPTLAALAALCVLALPAVVQAETCPNAAFRGGPSALLPECRAYELVTPPYKEGYKVFPRAVSTDGEGLLGESLGNFAGTGNGQFNALKDANLSSAQGSPYVFMRGASGWTTDAIQLPASASPLADLAATSSDFSESLWFAATPSQWAAAPEPSLPMGSFVLRQKNGSLVEVGPLFPPSVAPASLGQAGSDWEYVAASSEDLSHVLFTSLTFHWPGDATPGGEPSLYEYAGTGNAAPRLVGVSGGASSTSLIGRCATLAGAGKLVARSLVVEGAAMTLESQHVISASGATVFFTAEACGSSPPVDELFARVDNGQPDAHTVAISEPTKEDCEACDTSEGVLANATFLAASVDGSKVFWVTSQPLLGGDSSYNIYEYDFNAPAGQRVVRVSAGDQTVANPTANVVMYNGSALAPLFLAVSNDGSHVYFAATGVLTTVPNADGQVAQSGADNIYVFERDAQYPTGHIAFVAGLSGIPLNSIYLPSTAVSLSENGRFLAFSTGDDLTSDDSSTIPQAFEYDAQTGSLVRISIGQDGFNDDGNTDRPLDAPRKVLVANDGVAFFESGDGLTPQAIDNDLLNPEEIIENQRLVQNVYEYRAGNVYLISDGHDTSGLVALNFIDPSGANVFFETESQLASQDGDSQVDTYDARIDGGFSSPPPVSSCVTDACQGALGAAPALLSPSSEFQAGGNPPLATSTGVKPAAKPKLRKKAKKKRPKAKKTRRARRGRS